MAVDTYGRDWSRGVQLNNRTLEMLEITELRGLRLLTPLSLSQDSYSSSVSQSGGTHDGGSALDVRTGGSSAARIDSIVEELRKTGFAAWHPTPDQGDWPEHVHAVAIGDTELSQAAKDQVADYKAGRNGLANNGPDDGPRVSWTEYRQDIDMSYYGPEKWDSADWELFWAWVHGSNSRYINQNSGDKTIMRDLVQNIHKATAVQIRDQKLPALDAKLDQILTLLTPPPPPPTP